MSKSNDLIKMQESLAEIPNLSLKKMKEAKSRKEVAKISRDLIVVDFGDDYTIKDDIEGYVDFKGSYGFTPVAFWGILNKYDDPLGVIYLDKDGYYHVMAEIGRGALEEIHPTSLDQAIAMANLHTDIMRKHNKLAK